MDQIKVALTILKKYHFWMLCVCIMVIAPMCWWFAAGSVAAQFQTRSQTLDGVFKTCTGRVSDLSNKTVIDDIGRQEGELRTNIGEAWELLYRTQRKKNPLPEIGGDQEFTKAFDAFAATGQIPKTQRYYYMLHLKSDFPDLREIGDVIRPKIKPEDKDKEATKRPAPAPLNAPPPALPQSQPNPADKMRGQAVRDDEIGTVEWTGGAFEKIKSLYTWDETPSSVKVVLTQEDLWVYQALLRAIRNANEGAASRSKAAVKSIVALEIGKAAADAWGKGESRVYSGQVKEPEAPPPEGAQIAGGMGGRPPPGAAAAAAGTAPLAGESKVKIVFQPGDDVLLRDRYVDATGKPVPLSAEPPFYVAPNPIFNMMPVRMELLMDQRKLPKLLVACANSSMPIEVRRIRVFQGPGAPFNFSLLNSPAAAAPATPGLGGGPKLGGGPAPAAAPAGPGANTPASGTGVAELMQYDVPVEIEGVIYIYNPPDRKLLGLGPATDKEPGTAREKGGDSAEPNDQPLGSGKPKPADADAAKPDSSRSPAAAAPAKTPPAKTPPAKEGGQP